MPSSAQSRCLPSTYARTRVVADQDGAQARGPAGGGQRGHPYPELGLDRGEGGPAVQHSRGHVDPVHAVPAAESSAAGHRRSVEEVAGAGEVQGDAGRRGGGDHLLVAHRSARLRRPRGRRRRSAPRARPANGKYASDAAPSPARPFAGPGHREPGGVDPVHLAHADADRGAVAGQQDRVGLGRPDRPPGEGRSASTLGGTGSPVASVHCAGSSPGASIRSGVCTSSAAGDLPELHRGRTPPGATRTRRFFLRGQDLHRPVRIGRSHDDLGEHGRDLPGHLGGHRTLAAITPPNAETGSQAWALRWASAMSAPTAMPQGLACLMMATAARRSRGTTPGRVGVDVVVVRHLLAAQLFGLGQPRRRVPDRCTGRPAGAGSRRSAAPPPRAGRHPRRPATAVAGGRQLAGAPAGDRDVVLGDVGERLARRAAGAGPGSARPRPAPRATNGYAAGEVTTATLAWFLAAARTIAGPPMSICSTHSRASARRRRWRERVQVADQQVERLDAQLGQLVPMAGSAAGRPAGRRAPSGAGS